MHLQRVGDALFRDLIRPATVRRFAALTGEEPVLRCLGTPQAVLALLRNREVSGAERNHAVVALLRVAQRSGSPEPLSLLVVAFLPGLVSVCVSVRRTAPRGLEVPLEVLVLETFVEAVHAFPLQTQAQTATLGLLFATRRAALQQVHRSRRHTGRHTVPVDEQRGLASTTVDPEGALLCRELAPEISLDALREHLRDVGLLRQGSTVWDELTGTLVHSRASSRATRSPQEDREHQSARRARHRLLHGAPLKKVRVRLSAFREHLPLFLQEGWQ